MSISSRDARERQGTSTTRCSYGNWKAAVRGTNSEGSSDFTFDYTIYAAGTDLLPPIGVLTSSVTNITSTGLDIAWDAATDNYGVAGYNVYAQPVGVIAISQTK